MALLLLSPLFWHCYIVININIQNCDIVFSAHTHILHVKTIEIHQKLLTNNITPRDLHSISFLFLLRIKCDLSLPHYVISWVLQEVNMGYRSRTWRNVFSTKNWSFLFITRLRCWYSMTKPWYDISNYVILRAFLSLYSCLLKMNIMCELLETIWMEVCRTNEWGV